MLLSLTLTQAARSAGRSCLFTHYNCHCHIASPPMTSTLFLSLTHSRCLLPILISILLQLLPCPLLLLWAREREGERKIFVRWASKREKERELTSRSLPRSRLLDRNLQNRNWDKSLLWVLSSPWASPNPSFVSAVGWGWARCVGGRGWEGGPWDIRPCPTPYRIFTKKVFLENRQSVFGDKIERLGNYENEQKMKSALAHRLRSCPSSERPPFKSRSSLRLDVLGQCVRWTKLEAFLILCREIMNYHKCSIGERWRWWWYEREKGNNGLCPAFRGGGQFHLQDLYLIDVTRHLKKYFW